MTIVLSEDQQNAYEGFANFIMDPTAPVFVIRGYSGTGKSTLVKALIERLPNIMSAVRLVHPSMQEREIILTATTNKACEALTLLTHQDVRTIHSVLGLRVNVDYTTGKSQLVPRNNEIRHDAIIFIDEASYVDSELLTLIFKRTKHCKIIFMGDPAQLLAVGSTKPPVFQAKFPEVSLTKVMRQAEGNQIVHVSSLFRKTVETGEFFHFTPDGEAIKWMDREEFDQAILAEFNRPDWKSSDSKVLAWTNKCVQQYNHGISKHITGNPQFQVGDYGVCNRFMSFNGGGIKTDETVLITHISELTLEHEVLGNHLEISGRWHVFLPKRLEDRKAAIKKARDEENYGLVAYIENNWIDLRAAYACTVNKSQGSTFGKVFIDLDDIKKCHSGDQIARMMYVGTSRASHEVIYTGDLV